jgi:hypothetical protein
MFILNKIYFESNKIKFQLKLSIYYNNVKRKQNLSHDYSTVLFDSSKVFFYYPDKY